MVVAAFEEGIEGVDALCKRWASLLRDGREAGLHPVAKLMLQAAGAGEPGAPPEIPDDIMVLDRILASSAPEYHALVVVWYRHSDAVIVKAKNLHISRQELYNRWKRTLEYLKGRLHGEGVVL